MKQEIYKDLLKQIETLSDPELEVFANWCQMLALIKHNLNLFWIGIYIVKGDKMFLSAFQGLPACTRIALNKGACGKSASQQKTIIIKDVSKFKGYIACHHETASEIVIPAITEDGKTLFVLDIDSTEINAFNETDSFYLEKVVKIFQRLWENR